MKLKHLLALLISGLSISLHALDSSHATLRPYEIQYQTKAKGFNLKTVRKLEKQNNVYELNLVSSTMMMQTSETSRFSVDDDGIFSPHSYFYNRKILGNNSTRHNDFFPLKKMATFTEKKGPAEQVVIPDEVYDVLSYHEKIRLELLMHEGQFPNRSFHVLERARVRQHVFQFSGTEQLSTALGDIDTIKIDRLRENSTRKTTVWLAKNWDYVIVKILHKEKGEPDYILNIVKGQLNQTPITGSKKTATATN